MKIEKARRGNIWTLMCKGNLAIAVIAVALLLHAAWARQAGQASGGGKQAQVFSRGEIERAFAGMTGSANATGGGGATLGDYGSHAIKLSLRVASGGAEVHAHFNDVILVEAGRATLITGGTVVDGKTKEDGETVGSAIQGGKSQTISTGDVVHIPAGTPHQMQIKPGESFRALVIKVKE